MKDFIKIMNKYIILMIINSIFGLPWFYFKNYFLSQGMMMDNYSIDLLPNIVDHIIRFIIVILLILDFKKEDLNNVVLSCLVAFFYPLLGIVIFTILLLEKKQTAHIINN